MTVEAFTKQKIVNYPIEEELAQRIINVIEEYGELTNTQVIGILELIKREY